MIAISIHVDKYNTNAKQILANYYNFNVTHFK